MMREQFQNDRIGPGRAAVGCFTAPYFLACFLLLSMAAQAQKLTKEQVTGFWLSCAAKEKLNVNDTMSFSRVEKAEFEDQVSGCGEADRGFAVWEFGADKQLRSTSVYDRKGERVEEKAQYTPWKVNAKKQLIVIKFPGFLREYRILRRSEKELVIVRTK